MLSQRAEAASSNRSDDHAQTARPHVPPSSSSGYTKRSLESPDERAKNKRKAHKVSRACDQCKARKARCSGTIPCDTCVRKGLSCVWEAKYSRGRPPTPPPSLPNKLVIASSPKPAATRLVHKTKDSAKSTSLGEDGGAHGAHGPAPDDGEAADLQPAAVPSPEFEVSEIGGQYHDPTSGLTFLHRAWNHLSSSRERLEAAHPKQSADQPIDEAGDRPFEVPPDGMQLPDSGVAFSLVGYYFESCAVTYRFLHRPTVSAWLEKFDENRKYGLPAQRDLGNAKVALILTICAIATFRQQQVTAFQTQNQQLPSLGRSDSYLCHARSFTDAETGPPVLESAQARLLQVLYLLQTSRMNQAWYLFGHTIQIIAALGLHRRENRRRVAATPAQQRPNYIASQCRKRTFWVAYTIDTYLCVALGRPRHYHDSDIDQRFPDCVEDSNMTVTGPLQLRDPNSHCLIDGLVQHARLAQILGNVSREIYTIKPTPTKERIANARKYGQELQEWRTSLPPQLGSIEPSILIPNFKRQSVALKLAYSHVLIHANRPFLLADSAQSQSVDVRERVDDCLEAAKIALETIDRMASDGSLFYSLWWTHYVAFCALAVVYVWEINQRSISTAPEKSHTNTALFQLAEICHHHLANATTTTSPSQGYRVILEELHLEAKQEGKKYRRLQTDFQPTAAAIRFHGDGQSGVESSSYVNGPVERNLVHVGDNMAFGTNFTLVAWDNFDWIEFDSTAYGQIPDNFSFRDLPVPVSQP